MSPNAPLSGIRVLALEHFVSAPWCTQILADAGAEVIKVERPGTGDPRRTYDPSLEKDGVRVSGGFVSYNRNKKSVAIDLNKAEGADLFLKLAKTADVVVENMRPGIMTRAGLGWDTLHGTNSRLIYCAISGFGRAGARRGPYSDWPAFDSVIQAMGGLASLIGTRDGPPMLAPASSVDVLTGIYAALGVLLALQYRERTGAGRFVDVAMYDVTAAFLERELMIQEWTGRTPTRGVDEFAPVGMFRCGDGGYVSLIIPTDEMWARCCSAIGRQDLIARQDLATVLKRSEAMLDVIIPVLEEWAAKKTQYDACAALIAAGQPAGMVQNVAQVHDCPHLNARGMFLQVDDPVTGPKQHMRLPVFIDDHDVSARRIPRLGEHTDQFLAALGIAETERGDLRARHVIG